jgi:uncharacterized membrane protein YphA (DoxX/SURF4 family)
MSLKSSSLQDFAVLLERLLLGAIFVWSGYGKLMTAAATTAYLAKLGLPVPEAAHCITVLSSPSSG